MICYVGGIIDSRVEPGSRTTIYSAIYLYIALAGAEPNYSRDKDREYALVVQCSGDVASKLSV